MMEAEEIGKILDGITKYSQTIGLNTERTVHISKQGFIQTLGTARKKSNLDM